jgi:phosphoribosylaminoimidazole-succinocarboxamide synthase
VAIRSLPLLSQGKVRSNYAVGSDQLLMVASDRLSAYDVIMAEPIPGKGALLTQMALFWFARLGPGGANIVPHHLTGIDPESVVAPDERDAVRGRSMVVKRLKPLPIEAVVRGYLAGSGWAEYQKTRSVCGVPLPPGLTLAAKLPEPIFTPATKAEMGAHDENISFERAAQIVGPALAQQVKEVSIRLYQAAAAHAAGRGILIADTKFEFGLDEHGTLTLMDEVLTPDSSRFWPADSWPDSVAKGVNPPSYDKQFVRDYLDSVTSWGRTAPPPPLPQAVIDGTVARYQEALHRLTA